MILPIFVEFAETLFPIIFIFETLICLQKGLKVVISNEEEQHIPSELLKLIQTENEINFVVGTADNGQHLFYKQNNLLPRTEIIKK